MYGQDIGAEAEVVGHRGEIEFVELAGGAVWMGGGGGRIPGGCSGSICRGGSRPVQVGDEAVVVAGPEDQRGDCVQFGLVRNLELPAGICGAGCFVHGAEINPEQAFKSAIKLESNPAGTAQPVAVVIFSPGPVEAEGIIPWQERAGGRPLGQENVRRSGSGGSPRVAPVRGIVDVPPAGSVQSNWGGCREGPAVGTEIGRVDHRVETTAA